MKTGALFEIFRKNPDKSKRALPELLAKPHHNGQTLSETVSASMEIKKFVLTFYLETSNNSSQKTLRKKLASTF